MNGAPRDILTLSFWILLGFVSGAVPYAMLLTRAVCGMNIRTVGDGNPGAANAFRAGGWKAGVPTLVLDFLKAALPVGAATFGAGLHGWALVPVALAPMMGHAFSPFLHWRGGKAVTAAFGMWAGLTLWEGPVILGALLTLMWIVLDSDAWSPVIACIGLAVWMVATRGPSPALAIAFLATALIAIKQGRALARPPRFKRPRSPKRNIPPA